MGESTEYWSSFSDFANGHGRGNELVPGLGRHNYQTYRIPGVVWSRAHIAAAVSERDRGDRRAGNRVQIVFMSTDGREYQTFSTLRPLVDRLIRGLDWREEPFGKRSHVEVWKPSEYRNPDAWAEDFGWMLEHLLLFQERLGPHVRSAVSATHR